MTQGTVYGLKHQARAMAAVLGGTEKNMWLVGLCGLKQENEIQLIDYDEDSDQISHASFSHPEQVLHLASSPSKSDLFTSVTPDYAKLWRLSRTDVDSHFESSKEASLVSPLEEVSAFTTTDAFKSIRLVLWEPSGDTRKIIALTKREIGVYSCNSTSMQLALDSHFSFASKYPTDEIGTGSWSPHQASEVAVSIGNHIVFYDTRSKSQAASVNQAHELPIRTMDYNPNKPFHIASSGEDCKIRIWDTRNTKSSVKTISEHSHWVWSVQFNRSHDQLLLTSSSDCKVDLHSVVSVSSAKIGSSVQKVPDEAQQLSDDEESYEGYTSKTEDGLVSSFDEHEESVYSAQWSGADPWIFASVSYDGRFVVNQVPKDCKYKIIL